MGNLDRLLELGAQRDYYDRITMDYPESDEKEYQSLKQQILENQEKAEKYDDWQKPFTHRVYVPKLEQENKHLKENFILTNKWATEQTETTNNLKAELEKVSDKLGNELQVKVLEIEELKQKLEKIEELIKKYTGGIYDLPNTPIGEEFGECQECNLWEELKTIIEGK